MFARYSTPTRTPTRRHLPMSKRYARAFIGLLLVAAALASALPIAMATPASAMFAITLTDVFVSAADAATPGPTPVLVPAGGKFRAWYRITNPYDNDVTVNMDAELLDHDVRILDATGLVNAPCVVPAQFSIVCSRTFTVPADLVPGPYGLHLGIGLAAPSSLSISGSFEYGDWVIIQPAAAPIPSMPIAPTPTPAPFSAGGFFPQTSFWVRDGVPLPDGSGRLADFLSEFSRLGGIATLGYPASRPYWADGFFYQTFQRGILQWRPDYDPPQAVLANTMDWLHDAGKDDFLFSRGIPRHFTGDDGAGGNFERAKEIRLGWLTDPAIRDAYFANPNPDQIPDSLWDPVTFYGLPTSQPQSFGPFTTQRFQRYVLQKWEQPAAGMPAAGSVVGVLAGDLAKEAGLVPAPATQTEAP
ncbi:MAG: hypothetical protein M1380_00080 [Chloroflexi bacterium]|nr:hypothetical protein [Chloroflexota bacterium]